MKDVDVDEYISKMYKDGFDGIQTEEGVRHTGYCPFCGSTFWDYNDNSHNGKSETVSFDCEECGSEWVEEWNLTRITKTNE